MPTATTRPPAVVDTNVFGAEIVRRTGELARLYRPILLGRPLFVSFQTVAELRYGARLRRWGQHRLQRLELYIARAEVVWPHDELVEAYVDVRVRCERSGHALAQRHHDADRWVAATAIWLGIPLVAHDGIFRNAPGLTLETMLES